MVLLHSDFSSCNIMVDESTGRLTGVIDWAEAVVCPFGQNLYTLEDFSGTMHRENGWRQYEDYNDFQETFWKTFDAEVGGLPPTTMQAIKASRIIGCLLTHGFIRSLAGEKPPIPIQDDEKGRYNRQYLDAYLLRVDTRFEDLNQPSYT
jgi:hypothetical protein